jgi:hypothetical protein
MEGEYDNVGEGDRETLAVGVSVSVGEYEIVGDGVWEMDSVGVWE